MSSPDGRGGSRKKKRKERKKTKDLQIQNLRRELEVTRDRLKISRSEGKHTQASCSVIVSPDPSDSEIMTAAAAEQIRSVEAADEILRHDNQVVTAGIPAITRKANMIDMRKTI